MSGYIVDELLAAKAIGLSVFWSQTPYTYLTRTQQPCLLTI